MSKEKKGTTKQAVKEAHRHAVTALKACLLVMFTFKACAHHLLLASGQVLPPPVFHELREAVNTNRWLDWDQVR